MQSSTRAKVYVAEVTHTPSGGSVVMRPVCRGEDNKAWSAATPSGEMRLAILNPDALAVFVPGAEMFVDFTVVPEELAQREGMGE